MRIASLKLVSNIQKEALTDCADSEIRHVVDYYSHVNLIVDIITSTLCKTKSRRNVFLYWYG